MLERGLHIHSVSAINYNPATGNIVISGTAVEINRGNIDEVMKTVGIAIDSQAFSLAPYVYDNIQEKLDYIKITEGALSNPRLFSLTTEKTSLNFCERWHRQDSPISFEEVKAFMFNIKNAHNIRLLYDVVNFLMFGN